jgi:sulfoxide reductase heme-binding subunit YedZ
MQIQVPWRDRRGRLIRLKAAVFATLFIPGLLTAIWLASGQLGSRPLNEAIHQIGLWTIRWLLIALAITPCARLFNMPQLLLVRRMIGVAALAYGILHLTLYTIDQKFALLTVASEIARRFYLTIGFVALLGLAALGATSTDKAMRSMGRNWKRLHRLSYPIAVLALLHYFIQSKANVSEPVFVAGLYVWLMLWRVLPQELQRRFLPYPVLAVVAGVATAGIEFAWYGLATRINPWRVLGASETLHFGLRPAHYVLLCGLAVALLLVLQRVLPTIHRRSLRLLRSG